MLDHKVSPLLDAMEVGECFARHDGASCYRILHPESGREFVLKHISVPAGQEQVEALLLTGAYASEAEADAYYRKEAEALVHEAEARKRLLDCPYILPFLGVQMEKKERVGYDVYAVLPKRNSLQSYLKENAVSHLRGINMGIDLCVALAALREEGYVHGNLKPGNVFFSDSGRFLLGDFGLISTQDIEYAILPEQYRSSYSAPELGGILGGVNTTVDIYSLGMILYRIYNGNHAPFEDEKTSPKAADNLRIQGEPLPAPLYADYELAQIILKACAFDPAERYQNPDQMRTELEQYMRRNAVSDRLIVPPLVHDEEPLSPEEAAVEPEPVRFTDPEKLDDSFKRAFAPEGSDTRKDRKEKKDKKEGRDKPAQTQPGEKPAKPGERRRPDPKQEKAKKRRRRIALLCAALVLLIAAFCVYEFTDLARGKWHFFVKVDSLELSEITDSSLRLSLRTNIDPDDFSYLCEDDQGKRLEGSFSEGSALVEGLAPDTRYHITVKPSGPHSLSGETAAEALTKARTEVKRLELSSGSEEGAVLLRLELGEGARQPERWSLAYSRAGAEPETVQFSGSSYELSGLTPGEEYLFQLQNVSDLYLSGQTEARFTPIKAVRAEALTLDTIVDGEAVVSWLCRSELPETWTLSCVDPEGNSLPAELHEPAMEENAWRCSATIPNVDPGVNYSLTLSAEGLFQPLTMELQDSVIFMDSFTAAATADGLELRWVANREPEAGWIVTAEFGGGLQLSGAAHGNEMLLAVLPDTDYALTIRAADDSVVTGYCSATVRSAPTQRFTQMGLNHRTTIGTYYTPNREDWSYSDLGGGTVRYRHDDRITFLITAGGWPQQNDSRVTIHYVIRDDSERVIHVETGEADWNSLWDGDRWAGQIPWLPETPGRYSFTIYLNSQRLGTIGFTLIE